MWECRWFLGASKFCGLFVAEHVAGCLSCPDYVECPAAVHDVGVSYLSVSVSDLGCKLGLGLGLGLGLVAKIVVGVLLKLSRSL